MKTILLTLLCLTSLSSYAKDTILQLNGKHFTIQMAITEEQQKQGLMQTQVLPENHGLLFVYSEPAALSFWMKDTLIALDILFFDSDGRLINMHLNAPPCTKTPCRHYNSQQAAQYVLEIKAGVAQTLHLQPGDQFTVLHP